MKGYHNAWPWHIRDIAIPVFLKMTHASMSEWYRVPDDRKNCYGVLGEMDRKILATDWSISITWYKSCNLTG